MATIRKRQWTHKGISKTAWIVTYTDNGGKRRQETFERKKDADVARIRIEGEVEGGTHTAKTQTVTLATALDAYMRDCERRQRLGDDMTKDTLRGYKYQTGRLAQRFGQKLVSEITLVEAENYAIELIEVYAQKTVESIIKRLTQTIALAHRRGWMKVNPLHGFSVKVPKKPRPKHFPTRPELTTLLIAGFGDSDNASLCCKINRRAYIALALFCGLRGGEICALSWSDVSFPKNIITVRHSMARLEGLKEPKTRAGNRNIPMSDQVRNALLEVKRWAWVRGDDFAAGDTLHRDTLSRQRRNLWKSGVQPPEDFRPEGFVIRSRFGEAYSTDSARRALFGPLMVSAGLVDDNGAERFTPHALRHAAASLFIEAGLPALNLQQVMGHANVSTTYEIYGHLFPDDDRTQKAVAAIGADLGAATARQELLTV